VRLGIIVLPPARLECPPRHDKTKHNTQHFIPALGAKNELILRKSWTHYQPRLYSCKVSTKCSNRWWNDCLTISCRNVTRSAETTHHHCGHVHNTITIAPPSLIQLSTISTLSYAEHHKNFLRASENAQGFATSEEAKNTALLILVVLYAY